MSNIEKKLYIIGIGYRPLGRRAREIVLRAGVVLASGRLAEVFARYAEYEAVKDRVKIINKVPETVEFLRHELRTETRPDLIGNAEHRTVVLLASGDPLFFGIGRRMVEEFGSEQIDIIPDLSSMQEAFARINEPWDDAFCISLHGGPDVAKRRKLPHEVADLPQLLDLHGKLAILTDRQNNPAEIARSFNSALRPPHSALRMQVCERLGYPDERIWSGSVNEAAGMTFREPNVVVLQKTEYRIQKTEVRFGLNENDLSHSRGLITKDEVRAAALHRLRLPGSGVFWDIGAGSGSVSIEAARLAPGLRVFAVEKDNEQIGHIRSNIRKFGVATIEIKEGTAPDVLADLPAPDRVFIGGSGGRLEAVIEYVSGRMPAGVVVINAATLETLQEGIAALERFGYAVDVSELSVSRSKIVSGKRLMSAQNPIFIVKGERG